LIGRSSGAGEEHTMDEEQGERSFTVSDRRFSARRDTPPDRAAESATAKPSASQQEPRPRPQAETPPGGYAEEVNLASFLISLGTQAFMHLGEIPNPMTQKREKDITAAKQMIDLLGMLQAKTKGNLTGEEEHLLQQLLFDLRLRYVRETGR
jgi:hypothetical protein